MDKKAKNTMMVSVIALALVLIGVTYAYFSARITGLESASTISLTAGRMGIQYSEDDATVSVSNIYPREEAWITKQITLTGWNTTNQEMKYELGLNIDSNTFKGGQLTFDLTGVGTNGTKIADITGKSITKTSGFFKFGTGIFLQSDGDTHVYTLKIYFKDNGKDQNMNQEAVFNAKIDVNDDSSNNDSYCYFEGTAFDIDYDKCMEAYLATFDGWGGEGNKEDVIAEYTPIFQDACTNRYYTMEEQEYDMANDLKGEGMFYLFSSLEEAEEAGVISNIRLEPFNTINDSMMQEGMLNFNKGVYSYIIYSGDTSWTASLMDYSSTESITEHPCSSISGLPVTRVSFAYAAASSIDLSGWDASNITDMSGMFSGSHATNINLSGVDTSNVTTMSSMFSGSHTTSINLSGIDTSNVTNMSYMFSGSQVTNLDLSSFDTSNVTDMNGMFYQSQATSIDLSSFDTSSVTKISQMFSNMTNISYLNISNFDTSNMEEMLSTFAGSTGLTTLDLSGWDTSKVYCMGNMFNGCTNLQKIYVSDKFVISGLGPGDPSQYYSPSYHMFYNCTSLVGGAGTTYNSNKTNREYARIDGGTSSPGYFTAK